jgi:hypothetical protein
MDIYTIASADMAKKGATMRDLEDEVMAGCDNVTDRRAVAKVFQNCKGQHKFSAEELKIVCGKLPQHLRNVFLKVLGTHVRDPNDL